MGAGQPGHGRRGELSSGTLTHRRWRTEMARQATIDELEDWERQGAVWRTVEVSDKRAVVDLCSCSGERMERVESDDPELIAFIRAHPPD